MRPRRCSRRRRTRPLRRRLTRRTLSDELNAATARADEAEATSRHGTGGPHPALADKDRFSADELTNANARADEADTALATALADKASLADALESAEAVLSDANLTMPPTAEPTATIAATPIPPPTTAPTEVPTAVPMPPVRAETPTASLSEVDAAAQRCLRT
jgi:hypothetical protein